MNYASPLTDLDIRNELMTDLSGLVVGSAFLLSTPAQAERLLKLCDDAAKTAFSKVIESGKPAGVECITLDAGGLIGFDSMKVVGELADDALLTQVYRYFDTPREAIVTAFIAAPSEIKKTREVTFFCGPDRRKSGQYRIFSIHPGPKRQPFPNRYQPEAIRKENRSFWDRHVFLATPNQLIACKLMMREAAKDLEAEARERVYHMAKQIDGALHRWYGTWENISRPEDVKSLMEGLQEIGDFVKAPDGAICYFISKPPEALPDLNNMPEAEKRFSNPKRPSIIRPDGSEEYFLGGKRHRIGKPAVIRPLADGGWEEIWYEDGLVSRLPEEGPAKTVYNAKGEIIEEKTIYRGAEVEETTLGAAAEPVRALQSQIVVVMKGFKWFEECPDFQLLRGQLDFASNRTRTPINKIVRQMQQKDEQVGLRWDFDRTLEQDEYCRSNYGELVKNVKILEDCLMQAAQAMRFVKGEPSIVAAIWGKVMRDLDRLIERGERVPGIPGKTIVDSIDDARAESKKFYQTLAEQSKVFSATGK